jgi:hypothetical protein
MAENVIDDHPRPEDQVNRPKPFQRCRLEDQVNNYIAEFFFNINELLQ